VPHHLIDRSGAAAFELDGGSLERLAGRPDFYWLDLHGPSAGEVELLGRVFGHPLAVEDATHFGQRS
jgi:Mg2+ and Co2+ transporter CorA